MENRALAAGDQYKQAGWHRDGFSGAMVAVTELGQEQVGAPVMGGTDNLPDRQVMAMHLQAMRSQIAALRQTAPTPALEALLATIQEYLFVAQEYADPQTITDLTPYDAELRSGPESRLGTEAIESSR
jgi:hypothetical protein